MDKKTEFLVVVDIQPAYEDSCVNIIYDIVERINSSDKPVFFFFVGRDMDCDSKSDVIGYLLENGIDENKLNEIRFIEKDYGFFRTWLDNGIPHDTILKTIIHMNENQITDTKDFTEEDWVKTVGDKYSQLAYTNEYFGLPSFNQKMFKDTSVDNFELVGGGRYECLLEIDLFLKGLGKNTVINESLCYGADNNKSRLHKTGSKKMKKG